MTIYSLFIRDKDNKTAFLPKALNILIAVALFMLFFLFSYRRLGMEFDFSFLWSFCYRLAQGFVATVELSLASLVVSLFIGFLSALANNSRILVISYFPRYMYSFSGYAAYHAGLPVFLYHCTAWGVENRFLAGVLILSIFEGAYISEIIREALSQSNVLNWAARAIGLKSGQTMRLVVLPQIIKRTLPSLAGQFASIIKDSSLLSLISSSS